MARASYYRKRSGYRAYMTLLWQGLWPLLEATAPPLSGTRLAVRLAPELPAAHRERLVELLAEFGATLKAASNLSRLPETAPPFFMLGAEIPAPKLMRTSKLFQTVTGSRGRFQPPRRARPSRPAQDDVTAWLLAAAEAEALRGSRIKLREAERACMAALGASRGQVRVGLRLLPTMVRRGRGERDRAR